MQIVVLYITNIESYLILLVPPDIYSFKEDDFIAILDGEIIPSAN